ncbi:hypothetical protein B0T24DRAFT_376259 [Lasiosphaeria ovina]|uniref:DUF7728 domain-containing protein n=1 Tax=Lasiosphaeria ovina TaxID=92902 RepID=A0AAE0JZ06_9PEZI|nr:hypothetical protein B0T24DRAFT_376259 [Lasiosphaeria ovina]
MLFKPLAIAAASLLAAPAVNAFLLPPELTEADLRIADPRPLDAAASVPSIQEKHVVKLECPGCPLVLGPHVTAESKPNHLELSFTVDHQPTHDRLLLNGFELYPVADPMHNILAAPQVLDRRNNKKARKDAKKNKEEALVSHHKFRRPNPKLIRPALPLGFGLEVHAPIKDTATGLELIAIDLDIIEIGTVFMDGIPSVHVKLIKQADGRLLVHSIEKSDPVTSLSSAPSECVTVLCRWMAAVHDKIQSMKASKPRPCHGNKAGAAAAVMPVPEAVAPAEPAQDFEAMPIPHHRKHSWSQLFKNIASHILLPVLIGIVAGVSVSLVGMVVGTLIVSLWRRFFRRPSSSSGSGHRRHHSHHSHHRASLKEAVIAEEKAGLMEYQEEPSPYQDEVDPIKTVV